MYIYGLIRNSRWSPWTARNAHQMFACYQAEKLVSIRENNGCWRALISYYNNRVQLKLMASSTSSMKSRCKTNRKAHCLFLVCITQWPRRPFNAVKSAVVKPVILQRISTSHTTVSKYLPFHNNRIYSTPRKKKSFSWKLQSEWHLFTFYTANLLYRPHFFRKRVRLFGLHKKIAFLDWYEIKLNYLGNLRCKKIGNIRTT